MNWTLPNGTFFAGNEAAKAQITSRLSGGVFPHAILLEGPIGSGRRTFGRILAAAAVCSADEKPCGHCSACRKVFSNTHPDVTVVQGEGGARSFHLDVVRQLREDAYILPNEADRRVFVLCDVQEMTEQAQNALLKILEEPPSHALFILTCEQRSQLLETVLSRVFPLSLGSVPAAEAVTVLQQHLPHKTSDELQQAVSLWGGIIGQALQGLQDGSYQEILGWLPTLSKGIVSVSELDLLRATAPLEKKKEAIPAVLSGLQSLLRDALVFRRGCTLLRSTDPATAQLLAHRLSDRQVMDLLAVIEELQTARLYNMNYTLFLTLLCSRLRRAAGR